MSHPPPTDPRSGPVKVLPNGLRLVQRFVPGELVAIYLWFDAGTVDERDGEHGAAHLLEHMLFKGTARRGVGQVAAEIEGLGGDLNAYTTWDQTVLHATVLAEHWEAALDVLTDMAWSSTLDADELGREAPVVQEEIRGYDSDPDAVLEDVLTARLFPGHPYGDPVLGTLESVAAIDRARLQGFWRRHYTPDRCILAVAGPVDADALEAAALRLSAAAPAGAVRATVPEAARPTPGIHRLDRVFDTILVGIAWKVPGDDDATDLAALEVLAAALGSGRASLLQAELRVDRRLVADAWATLHTRRTSGSLEVGLAPIPGEDDEHAAQEALAATLEIVERVKSGALSALDVERAKQGLLADLLADEETVDGVAHELAWFTSRGGDPRARETWRRDLSAVDASDVLRVARRWLVDPVVLVLDAPESPVPTGLSAITDRRTAARDPRVRFSGDADRWAHQGPFASVYLAFPGGKLLETPRTAGTTSAWSSMVTSGAGGMDSVELASELDRLAATLGAVAGRNTLGIHLSVPTVNLSPALDLLEEVLREPRFDAEDWDREREEMLLDLDTLADRPDDVLARRMWATAFDGHPWGLVRTRTTLRAVSARSLRAFHDGWITSSGVQVGVAGDLDPEPVAERVHELLEALPSGAPVRGRPPLGEHPVGTTTRRAGHEQALVAWAARTPPIGAPDEPALRVAIGLLSAQAGRLFMALRERNSLAYSVWARLWEGPDAGMFAIGLATEPGRIAAARAGLLEQLDRLRQAGPDADELARTRRMLLGQHGMGLQRASGRAAQIALGAMYGRDPSMEATRSELMSVSAEHVRDAVARLPEGFVTIVRP